MTVGFLLFGIGLALVVSALKDQTVAEILSGVIGADVPLGKSSDSSSATGTQPSGAGSSGVAHGPNPLLLEYLQKHAHEQFGLTITEPIGRDSGSHVADSLHKSGRAFDASGTPAQMKAFTDWLKHNFGSSLTELIHNPGGSIKNGKSVPSSFWNTPTQDIWGGHAGHVHVGI